MTRTWITLLTLLLGTALMASDGQTEPGTLMKWARGLLGIVSLIGIAWIFSSDRKNIPWALVGKAVLLQIGLALLILKVPFVAPVFDAFSMIFVKIISFTDKGTEFLFGSFAQGGEMDSGMLNFAFTILPTIVFFSALTSIGYYYGILQKVVKALGWVMRRTLRLSGAESLSAVGNIFLGQTESPLLIRPYLSRMTRSEIMCLMTGGMATIAGGVLAAYISFLGGPDTAQQEMFAKHLLAASFMSAPAAILAAKMLVPEREQYDESMNISKEGIGSNVLEAISNGTSDGLKLAINVGAMLLVFTALVYMVNGGLAWAGDILGLNDIIASGGRFDQLSIQFILAYVFAPVSWLIGVQSEDVLLVGQLLGEKTVINEFFAYVTLGNMKAEGLFHSERSILMATYVLCGFANFASIGIQIGGIGALVPNRKGLLSSLGVRALIGGTLACLFTATVVGMLI